MSNTPIPSPIPPKTGMPKWLIILLIVFGFIVLGCCGGFVTCTYIFKKAAQNAPSVSTIVQEQLEKAAAEEAARTGSGGTVAPAIGRLPSNFPKDIPVMTGLDPIGLSSADLVKGAGMATLGGKMKREDVVSYYQKQMKDQGWTTTNNMEIGEATMMTFTKDTRQATIQATTGNDQVVVQVIYETKP